MSPLYTLSGVVIAGQKRGAKMGFPTANVMLTQSIPEGIYASTVKVGRGKYLAATFIGSAKTFNEEDIKAESFILDFSEDIYGKSVEISLFKKIRNNESFSSVDDLIFQMQKDIVMIKNFFKNFPDARLRHGQNGKAPKRG